MSTLVLLMAVTLVIYGFFLQIREYNILRFTSYRFRYFALRDRLAMMVVQGKLQERSWEYQQIVQAINFHISAVETMSIISILEMVIHYHTTSEEQCQVSRLKRRIDDPAVAAIMVDYMGVTSELIRRNSRVQILLIKFAKQLLAIVGSAARPRHEIIMNPNQALEKIETRRSAFQSAIEMRQSALHAAAAPA